MRYESLIFDLFGTLVLFRPKPATGRGHEPAWRRALDWLRAAVEDELPGIDFDEFLGALAVVTKEIVETRPPEYFEVDSEKRFARVLARLGVDGTAGESIAGRLCAVHMGNLAQSTEMPEEHGRLLRSLAGRYRLGLVSNFDHAPTARRILDEHGIARAVQSVVISAEIGRRKPHAALFETALRELHVPASRALFVGDTIADDVRGALGVGMDVAWINRKEDPLPPAVAPTYTLGSLLELPSVLS